MEPEIILNPIQPLNLRLPPQTAYELVELGRPPERVAGAWNTWQASLQTGAFFAAIGFHDNRFRSLVQPLA